MHRVYDVSNRGLDDVVVLQCSVYDRNFPSVSASFISGGDVSFFKFDGVIWRVNGS